MRSISVADHEHERVHPDHVRADDREDACSARGGGGRRRPTPVSVMSPTITAKLAWPASSAGITPGRRTQLAQRRGRAARPRPRRRGWQELGDLACGSGRTNRTSTNADEHEAARRPARAARATSPSSSRPASSGLNTSGPRIAPKTAPKSTSAMPRARCSGGYMSPGRGAREQRDAARRADARSARASDGGRERRARCPAPASPQPRRPGREAQPRAPARGRSGPSRGRRAAPRARPRRARSPGPSPSSPSTSRTCTSVSEATAAESCSIAEFAASEAESRSVLRRIGREAGSATARAYPLEVTIRVA